MSRQLTPSKINHSRKLEFDKKLAQIEKDEQKIKALHIELEDLQSRVFSELRPLVDEFCKVRWENILILDQFLTDPTFKKKEKRLLINLLIELAQGLEGAGDQRGSDYLASLMNEEEEEEPLEQETFERSVPPSSKTESTEVKPEIKSLFRELAKAFHPDREPEEHLKVEKTALMKKITAAYEAGDLHSLLQLEKEHMGPRELTEDKLEIYINYINERIKQVKAMKARLTKYGPLASVYQLIYSRRPGIMEANIKNELDKMEQEVERERDLQPILLNQSSLKEFLRARNG